MNSGKPNPRSYICSKVADYCNEFEEEEDERDDVPDDESVQHEEL